MDSALAVVSVVCASWEAKICSRLALPGKSAVGAFSQARPIGMAILVESHPLDRLVL